MPLDAKGRGFQNVRFVSPTSNEVAARVRVVDPSTGGPVDVVSVVDPATGEPVISGASVRILANTASAVSGVAPAGATVTVSRASSVLGTTTANGSGAWSYTVTGGVAVGHVFTATAPVVSSSYTAPPVALPLGPTTASFTAGTTAGRLIAAITGLSTGETIDTIAPNDGRLVMDTTKRNLLVGLSASAAGAIAATLTTSAGRTLSMAITVSATPPLAISGTPATTATAGFPYSFTPQVQGGAVSGRTFSYTGTLLSNWSFDPLTGTINSNSSSSTGTMSGLAVTVSEPGLASATLTLSDIVVSAPAQQATPLTAMGAAGKGWLDATDPSTMYQDDAGTIPIVVGGTAAQRTVAAMRMKTPAYPNGDPNYLWRPEASYAGFPAAVAPIWSPTAFNGGLSPGLIFDGTARSAYGCNLTLTLAPLGGLANFSVGACWQKSGAEEGGSPLAFDADADRHGGTGNSNGSLALAKIYGANGGLFTYSAAYWDGKYPGAGSGGGIGVDVPVRTYFTADGSTARQHNAVGAAAPSNASSVSTAQAVATSPNLIIGADRWGGGQHPGQIVVQSIVIASADLYATGTLNAVDAQMQARAGGSTFAVTLKNTATTGSAAAGSTTWNVTSTSGIAAGDWLVMEPTTGYGTLGPAGALPQQVGANEAAILSLTTSTPSESIRAADTGKCYHAKLDGSGYYPWDSNLYYKRYCQPLALSAQVVSVNSATQLTMSVAAVSSTTNANVYSNNAPTLKALALGEGSVIDFSGNPDGRYYVADTWAITNRKNVTIKAAGKSKFELALAVGSTGCVIDINQSIGIITQDIAFLGQRAKMTWTHTANSFYEPGALLLTRSSVDCRDLRCRFTEGHSGASVYRQINSGTLSGSDQAEIILTSPTQQYLANWQMNAVNCTAKVKLTNFTFTSAFLEPAFEAFQSDGAEITGFTLTNGRGALNSSKNCKVDGKMTVLPLCLPTNTFAPSTVNAPILDLNSNVDNSQGNTVVNGNHSVLVDIDIQGHANAAGDVNKGITVSDGNKNCTGPGTYIPNVKNDGLRRGSVRCPYPALRTDEGGTASVYSPKQGATINVNGSGFALTGYRLESFAVSGSHVPTTGEYVPPQIMSDADAATKASMSVTNCITGASTTSIDPAFGTQSGNVSNAAYAALP